MARRNRSHSQTSATMNVDKSTTSSSWNASRIRSRLLNSLSSGQDARPRLQAFLEIKNPIQVIRQLSAGEQAKLLELIDQVSDILIARPPSGTDEMHRHQRRFFRTLFPTSRLHPPSSQKTRSLWSRWGRSPATPDCCRNPPDLFKVSRNAERLQWQRAELPIFGRGL